MKSWPSLMLWRAKAVVSPPVTMGAQCLIVDANRHVLLVRPSYRPGFELPGGGIDPGESAQDAALRETAEETGYHVAGPVRLFSLYWNRRLQDRDHVALFVALNEPAIDPTSLRPAQPEIAEVVLAPIDDLPDGTAAATARRLAEVREGGPPSVTW